MFRHQSSECAVPCGPNIDVSDLCTDPLFQDMTRRPESHLSSVRQMEEAQHIQRTGLGGTRVERKDTIRVFSAEVSGHFMVET